MKSIITKHNNGKITGLLVSPQDGKDVSVEHLERLLSYIKLRYEDCDDIIKDIEISDGKYSFPLIEDINTFDKFIQFCNSNITERIIVNQQMGRGPTIRHRVFYFYHEEDTRDVIVKYTTLGEFNNIDEALNELLTYNY